MKLVFMGSPAFAVPTLAGLIASEHDIVAVVTQPDRRAGRGRSLRRAPAAEVAADHGLRLLQPSNVNDAESLTALRELGPEAIIVAAYGQILKQELLDIPSRGALNVHASLLPRHRGAAPSVGALLAGDEETGVTIQEIALALDSGPIVAQRTLPIHDADTAGSLNDRLSELGADLLMDVIDPWSRGEIDATPQDESQATYAPSVKRADAIIDWTMSATDIWRRVRAYEPWPVATTTLDGEPLQILEAWPADGIEGSPGLVVPLPEGADVPPGAGFAVVCGQGGLAVVRGQRAGKRPLSGEELLRGYRRLMGSRLGT